MSLCIGDPELDSRSCQEKSSPWFLFSPVIWYANMAVTIAETAVEEGMSLVDCHAHISAKEFDEVRVG